MERDVIIGVSRFGRLRKISNKLVDLPNRKKRRASTFKVETKCSQTVQKDLSIKVETLADLKKETFDQPLMDEETDSSSSIGDNDQDHLWEPSYGSTTHSVEDKLIETRKVI